MNTKEPRKGKLVGAVVFVLAFSLVGGGVFVLRDVMKASPSSSDGGANTAAPVAPAPGTLEKMIDDARIAQGQQDYALAERLWGKAAEMFPRDQMVRLEYARSLVTRKKFAEAYQEYQACLALTTKPAADGGTAQGGDPALHFEAGTVANEAGLVERAAEHYSMAQAADPKEPRYPLYLGMIQIKLGQESAGLASLVRATKLNPELAIGWGTLAELALKQNQLGLALQHVETARRLEPETARWRVVEARIVKRRGQTGDTERALGLLLSLEKADRMKPEVLTVIGECYGLLQRPADAAYMYAEAAKLKPDDAKIAYEASLWYHRAGNEADSLRYAKLAQDLQIKSGVVVEGSEEEKK